MPQTDTIRVEFHSHTVYSHDGHSRFEPYMRTAQRRRLDVVCVTDHDTIEGAVRFREQAVDAFPEIAVVVGEERTLANGVHVIGLFVESPLRSTELGDLVNEIHDQNGIVVAPHPYRQDGILGRGEPAARVVEWGIDAVEIFNPKCRFEQNEQARRLVEMPVGVTGGSDAHYECDLAESVVEIAYDGDVESSIRRGLSASGVARILAVRQSEEDHGRQYAAGYYALKKRFPLRVPKPLLPLARYGYRAIRNAQLQETPELREICRSDGTIRRLSPETATAEVE